MNAKWIPAIIPVKNARKEEWYNRSSLSERGKERIPMICLCCMDKTTFKKSH